MSRAFVKEGDQEEVPFVAPRAHLPAGVPNYVTPLGMQMLRAELEDMEIEFAELPEADDPDTRVRRTVLEQKLAMLRPRIASAQVINPDTLDANKVLFGRKVTLHEDPDNKPLEVAIVGVDQANPKQGTISYVSPLAKAMLGKEVNDKVILPLGDRKRTFTIVDICC